MAAPFGDADANFYNYLAPADEGLAAPEPEPEEPSPRPDEKEPGNSSDDEAQPPERTAPASS